jgi:hypothetical protein
MNDADETYQLLESDALSWLDQARGARLSADVIYAALAGIMPLSQTLPGVREKKLAYMQSFMLLTALAFENLLKGISVVDHPTGWKRLEDDGGHGISTFAAAVTTLSDAECDLLQRLQEYLVWAGRYSIPTRPTRYASKHRLRKLRASDPSVISGLFEKLSSILHEFVLSHSVLASHD